MNSPESISSLKSNVSIETADSTSPARIRKRDQLRDAFQRLKDTHRLEGRNKALLHGCLHIQIIKARHLRNKDCNCVLSFSCITNDVSDPFVTVHAGGHRLLKTSIIYNDLNPVWNEDFFLPVAHYAEGLKFKVKDEDFKLYSQSLGEVFLPVQELLRFGNDGRPLRVGIHKVAWLDQKARHGSLEFFVDYVPVEIMPLPMEVPGVYFKKKEGNRVKLYVNAEDGPEYGAPEVRYGGPDDNEQTWQPQRLWRDTYDAICQAKHFIYVTGWSVDVTQSLLRGNDKDEALKKNKYSPYIGPLLQQKAEEGVAVLMLIWDDATSNLLLPGMMGTHDEQAKRFFRNTKVNFHLCPMAGDERNPIHEKAGKRVMFTHHQKVLILDAPREGKWRERELLAFIGGIDLTNGRWDTREHSLFRSLTTDHQGDCHNACFDVDAASAGPREPWHDIHSSVRGPAVLDIIENFTERWKMQNPNAVADLVDLGALGLADPPIYTKHDTWCTQLFRSIDGRTALFNEDRVAAYTIRSLDDLGAGIRLLPVLKRGSSFQRLQRLLHIHRRSPTEVERRFVAADASSFHYDRELKLKKGRNVDDSAQKGMLYHIERAEHMVYIESQYFLSSAHLWNTNKKTKCGNLVAAILTIKICQKIEAGERFCAYIVCPMWPEGPAESHAVQAILRLQTLTMQAMYKRIAAALKQRREALKKKNKKAPEENPRDYLCFYCLANREERDGNAPSKSKQRMTPDERLLSKTRRHQVYVHSKMVIVDDAIALIGSANINQRSLDGSRDSEIVLGSWQPEHLSTKESIPHGDVHGFRMHCWATVTGQMEDVFRDPSSLACVRRLNEIAEENWKAYASEEAQEMTSHLVPYPIVVSEDGTVKPRTDNHCFPDTKGRITGKESSVLPEFLTT